MSDVIRLLPDSVANQIAAGEVIQRPASVVKELVENAIDAGADNITVVIKDAGRTLIQVVDNGKGMSDTDARLSFERHATSKITAADDLFALHTMGFRGEALASIAAVAQIDMRTMLHGAPMGTRILISGSRVESQKPEACVPGTNIMVKNLFFNVPARRKFLKKDAVELSNIMREWERLTLVNTDVDFTLVVNDTTTQQLRRGSLKQRIGQLFGKSVEKQIIPVAAEVEFVKIGGFVGLPEHGRHRNALQYFMVNGRNMIHPYFRKAVLGCYERLLAPDVQPNYFLEFSVDPASIDVNIHPTKHEIKFEDEKAIWQVLVAAVRESLGKFNAVPGIDFDLADTPEIPLFNPDATADVNVEVDPGYNPFREPPRGGSVSSAAGGGTYRPSALNSRMRDWDRLYDNFSAPVAPDARGGVEVASSLNFGEPVAAPTSFMQVGNRYILSPAHGGMMLVDRYRAMLRVLYDRFSSLIALRRFTRQNLLFSESITLSPAQSAVMAGLSDVLARLGFAVTHDGDNTWSIDATPAELNGANAAETVVHLLDDAAESGAELSETLAERMALTMARAAAPDARTDMPESEIEQLMSDLFKSSSPNFAPDGNRIITTVTTDQLAKLLG